MIPNPLSIQVLRKRGGEAPRYTVPAAGDKKLAYVLIPKPLNA